MTYTIGTLATMTGLSAHTIRAWEKRYHSLAPDRSESNRRIYTEQDLERLTLLRDAVRGGHSIGHVAHLPTDELKNIASRESSLRRKGPEDPATHYEACIDAVNRLDPQSLDTALQRGSASLGVLSLLEGVVIPLIGTIEEGWLDGSVRIAQEHMTSAVLRTFLDRTRQSLPGSPGANRLLVTTLPNQYHELGALMVAIVAATESWNVTWLGPNLPADEIVEAVRRSGARAVALSLVYPLDDENIPSQLQLLRDRLPPRFPLLVGGRAVEHYAGALQATDSIVITSFRGLQETLGELA